MWCLTCHQPKPGLGIKSSVPLLHSEVSLTGLVARALDRLLFDDKLVAKGVCLHQGPTRKQPGKQGVPECADIYIAQLDNTYWPSTPVLVSDMKVLDLEHTGNETACYSINVANTHHLTPALPVLLALPATATTASLEVHVPFKKNMWRIPIWKAPLTDRAQLSIVYAAVEYLYTCNNTHNDALTCMCPYQDWMTSNDWQPLGDHSEPSHHRVFLQEGTTVVKFYDSENQFNVPNDGLINETLALSEVKLQPLTSDGRIVALKYAYIEGDHKPQELWQFANVANILASIHEKGYVHGDVRIENIVFGRKKPGVLIDFREINTLYPEGYNYTILTRHPFAYCGEPMLPEHDMYSLAVVLKTFFHHGATDSLVARLQAKSTAVAALKELANVTD